MTDAYRDWYRGRRVMITGGLGFIGSNLARQLADLSADVLVIDSLLPDYGGNLFNVAGYESRLQVNVGDVRQQSAMDFLVRGREVIFNMAGQVSHIDSMTDPVTELEINCRGQLTLLEACRHHNRDAKIVYAGTRQVYGRPASLVDACLRAGATDTVNGAALNVGGAQPISHRDLVQLLIQVGGSGSVRYVEWPEEKKATTKFSASVGWSPRVSLEDGLRRSVDYYRAHLPYYLEAGA
jgi:nucleoside-diphosphate-sugar epimerase